MPKGGKTRNGWKIRSAVCSACGKRYIGNEKQTTKLINVHIKFTHPELELREIYNSGHTNKEKINLGLKIGDNVFNGIDILNKDTLERLYDITQL